MSLRVARARDYIWSTPCECCPCWSSRFSRSVPRPSRLTFGRTPKSRSNSVFRWLNAACGARPSTGGSGRRRSTRRTRRPRTISQSPTNTRATSTKRERRMRRPSSSNPTMRSSNRTTSCSRKSMTARAARILSSLVAVVLTAACTSYYEIPIETPIRPKLDVSAFQRVLIAGFISGGTDDVDGNLETTRLLRSQLRTKSEMRVIDTDVLPLMDVAAEGQGTEKAIETTPAGVPAPIKDDKDLEPYE